MMMPGTWLIGERSEGTGPGQETRSRQWRAVLLGLMERDGPGPAEADSLDELERLAATDGITVVERLVQVRDHPDPATYLGSGKVRELTELVGARHADLVIAEGEPQPTVRLSHQRRCL
jgi:GTP-binding protein HflX